MIDYCILCKKMLLEFHLTSGENGIGRPTKRFRVIPLEK